jgi:hypothetical protein
MTNSLGNRPIVDDQAGVIEGAGRDHDIRRGERLAPHRE